MGMKTAYSILLVLHVLTVISLLALLVAQARNTIKKIPHGFTHAGLTALVLGIAMIVINAMRHNHNSAVALLNHTKFGVKFLVLAVILGVAFKYAKRPSITQHTWLALVGLSIFNFAIASAWK